MKRYVVTHVGHPGKTFIVYRPNHGSVSALVTQVLGDQSHFIRPFDPKIDGPTVIEDARQVF